MPKVKTKKALAKRVKVTRKKKGLRAKAGRRHLLSAKTQKRKRKLRRHAKVSSAERDMIRRGLPYSF